jgi:hypothetical protein
MGEEFDEDEEGQDDDGDDFLSEDTILLTQVIQTYTHRSVSLT